MNYFEIGQRIRKYRREKHLSQTQLAERVKISVTHLSHIETANTKLSLPVFVKIADALGIRTDALLRDVSEEDYGLRNSISDLLDGASLGELNIIYGLVKTTKSELGKNVGRYRSGEDS
ncbi:MAG: helix-turn-helix domain-containing protein [Lachnospiraceae bacterium]|nr:helix-turn-helix domain-containing protein [Lachnospiraceae bacterium]